jgi:hypothetical protein
VHLFAVSFDKLAKGIALLRDLFGELLLQSLQVFLKGLGASEGLLAHVVFEGALDVLIRSVFEVSDLLRGFAPYFM